MRDVAQTDGSVKVLGQTIKLPLALAPIGLAGLMARRGEVQAARAAEKAGVPFCLSTVSLCSIEEVRLATSAPFWFQLYMLRDRGYVRELLQRAEAAGCSALVFTLDLAVLGSRYRDTRNGMNGGLTLAGKLAKAWDTARRIGWLRDVALGGQPLVFGNLAAAVPTGKNLFDFKRWVDAQFDASVTWRDLDFVRQNWRGPIILKGILDAGDARSAADSGAAAIIVSNHGGRQLDSAPSSIAALPGIVDAVGDRLEVFMDSGIRSGQDIAKALALGARAVLIGRAWIWALAARGEGGVTEVLDILARELQVTLALLGEPRADRLDSAVLVNPE
jgi:L-lactate dehydrogenase (cytochrome)